MKSNNEAVECKLEQLAVKVGYNSLVDTDEQSETIVEEEEEREREKRDSPTRATWRLTANVSPELNGERRQKIKDSLNNKPDTSWELRHTNCVWSTTV